MRCEICGEGEWSDGLPDALCWDARATPDEVHDWVRRIQTNPSDRAGHFLGRIGSTGVAKALRSYLGSDDPPVLALVVSSLGWSGDASDGPALLRLIEHDDKGVRLRAMESLAELEVSEAVEPLAARLRNSEMAGDERGRLLECLAWLRYPGILPELRAALQSGGLCQQLGRHWVADSLIRVGDSVDRAEMARLAISSLERSAEQGYSEPRYRRALPWDTYVRTVGAVAPDEVVAAEAGLSDAARLALTHYPSTLFPTPETGVSTRSLVRPRRTIESFTDSRTDNVEEPPAKFFGLPDWREQPSWPVGGDGRLLMFYGQLPIGSERTAYLFTAGPEEWEALGPGSAMVIQPGGSCHLPTVDRRDGPRSYDWVTDHTRFIPRPRRLPQQERFVVWSDGADPAEFGQVTSADDWNKVGGTPVWLQDDDTPGPTWSYVFQVEAGMAGSERGDGAVFYGWMSEAGEGALGWQSH